MRPTTCRLCPGPSQGLSISINPWCARHSRALTALWIGVCLSTPGVVWAAAESTKTGAAPAPRPALTVTVTTAQRAVLASTLAATGTVQPWQEASVGAEGAGWRLAEVLVQVGDQVRKGQLLARFDTRVAEADLAQQRAAVLEVEASLAEAAANAQRARELQPSGMISAQQFTQALTAERTLAARLEAQRAAVHAQELRLAQGQVLAPDDGVISARGATVGAVAPPGQELFRLIRQGRLEWRAEVPAVDLGRVRAGQRVRLAPVGAEAVTGRVRMVAPTVDPATRNGLVYVELAVGLGASGLKAGQFARGEFEAGQGEALMLPQSAVVLRDGFSWAFVLGTDQKVRQTKVLTGRREGERVEVISGLPSDARVVASGAGFLADGDTVRVVDKAGASPAGAAAPGAQPARAAAGVGPAPVRPGASR
jgi:HlyD family secretion protein